ncbi:MAG: hypothetical protein ACSHWS_11750 [Sulfitobacter sp.]
MTEEEKVAQLRRIMPAVTAALVIGTFVLIRAAGHDNGTALLVAGIMFLFAGASYLARIMLGLPGFLAFAVGGALLAWRLGQTSFFDGP